VPTPLLIISLIKPAERLCFGFGLGLVHGLVYVHALGDNKETSGTRKKPYDEEKKVP
jgi:hypothetical protein